MWRAGSALALLVLLTGCMYGFVGGGLPSHVRTVAILDFENATVQPLVETDVVQELQAQLPRKLGVRLAGEQVADALIRGRIVGYSDEPAGVRPSQPGADDRPVVRNQVRITYELEIFDVREEKPLWRAQSQSVTGDYYPDQGETFEDGRRRAIVELVNKVVEGAQSQW